MIVQVLLQVRECSLNLVVGIGHSMAVLPLAGKEIRQIEIKAVHGCSQPPVHIMQSTILVQASAGYRVLPFLLPCLIFAPEISLMDSVQLIHKCL